MTDSEKEKLVEIITSRIDDAKEEIEELKELVKPIPLTPPSVAFPEWMLSIINRSTSLR